MPFVLLRTGKIDVTGPFASVKEAADYIGENNMLGYQIVPITPPKNPSIVPLPRGEQDRENLEKWAENWPQSSWYDSKSVDENCGRFLAQTEKRFPIFFSGPHPAKINLIKSLRTMTYHKGVDNGHGGFGIGLKDAKDMVDDYFAVKGGF